MESKLKNVLKQLKLNESTVSMILGAMVVVVVGVLIYNYFTTVGKKEDLGETTPLPSGQVELVEEAGKLMPKNLPAEHTVVAGEYLWTIATRYYGNGFNWVDIAQANKLTNPNVLTAGQKLIIPKAEVKVKPAVSTSGVIEGSSYEVKKGDSLWSIAVRAYQDGYQWTKIAQANKDKLPNPNILEAGTQLTLPR